MSYVGEVKSVIAKISLKSVLTNFKVFVVLPKTLEADTVNSL